MRKLANAELNRLSTSDFKEIRKNKLIIILDNVRSLNNVGSVFRTADAFLVEAIYLCGITGTPPHNDIRKTALGADETVAWQYFAHTTDAVAAAQAKGYAIYAIEQAEGATMLNEFDVPTNGLALVFGNEVEGVAQDIINLANGCIEIPQQGSKHSLNIAVSVGIVVWQVVGK